MEQMDLLQAFEIIVDKAKNSSLGEKFYEEADSYLGFVSDKLDISKHASAIMALFATDAMTVTSSSRTLRISWAAASLACFDMPMKSKNLLTRNISAAIGMKVSIIPSQWR